MNYQLSRLPELITLILSFSGRKVEYMVNQTWFDLIIQSIPKNDIDSSLSVSITVGDMKALKGIYKVPNYAPPKEALFIALYKDHFNITAKVISHPLIDLNGTDGFGRTLLHQACKLGRAKVVKALIRNSKVDRNIRDCEGKTPLITAGDSQARKCQSLLLNDSRTNATVYDRYGVNSLINAVILDNLPMFKELLKHPDVNVNDPDEEGMTPLMMACKHDRREIAKLLTQDPRTNLEAEDYNGWTAKMWTVVKRNVELLELFE